ncbi:MAG: hypothetical protein AB7O96_15480 [Pseudobdellovibrionaceae bacterium]
MNKAPLILGLILISIAITSCSAKKDSEKMADAQYCLDDSTQETAKSCLSGIEGIESKQANYLRCAAGFLAEGFGDPDNLVELKSQLDTDGGTNQMAILSILAFKSAGDDDEANLANARATKTYCEKAGSSILTRFATAATMASILSDVANIDWSDPANLDPDTAAQLIEDIAQTDDPDMQAAVGDVVIDSYTSQCQNSTSEDCEKVNDAIAAVGGTDNPEKVGEAALCVYNKTLPYCAALCVSAPTAPFCD